jgi:hypothetical protein
VIWLYVSAVEEIFSSVLVFVSLIRALPYEIYGVGKSSENDLFIVRFHLGIYLIIKLTIYANS